MTGISKAGVPFFPVLAVVLAISWPCFPGPASPPGGGATGAGKPAPSGSVAQSGVLVPRDVYVGDEAEFTFETVLPEGLLDSDSVVSVSPSGLNQDDPGGSGVTVHSITVREKDGRAVVSIRFIPWVSGLVSLPSFRVGGHEIICPPVTIASLLDPSGQTALQPPRFPMLVPGTTYLLYGIVLAVLASLIVVILVVQRVRQYLGPDTAMRRSARRVRLLFRKLAWLERKVGKLATPDWYALFSLALRRYLGLYAAGSESAFLAATWRELQDILGDGDAPPLPLAGLCESIDRVRFSGQPCNDRRKDDLEAARELCRVLEGRVTDAVL